MGGVFSIRTEKDQEKDEKASGAEVIRKRSASAAVVAEESSSLPISLEAQLLPQLRSRRTRAPLCRSVLEGDAVSQAYGCHFHLYSTASPNDSHGVSLGWSVAREPLTSLSLLTLCRVANTSRKYVTLLGDDNIALTCKYTPAL